MDATMLLTSTVLAVLLVAGLVAAVLLTLAGRRRVEAELRAARVEMAALTRRLEEVSSATAARMAGEAAAPHDVAGTGRFLITSLVDELPARSMAPADSDGARLPVQRFLSVAAGESLVRLVSLGYGVRRALSPHNRNRIRFEMRQEVRRSRRRRRDEVKEARRLVRARQAGLAQDDAA
jgi:hypothetical protein